MRGFGPGGDGLLPGSAIEQFIEIGSAMSVELFASVSHDHYYFTDTPP